MNFRHSLISYIVGFALSLLFTFAAYGAVVNQIFPSSILISLIVLFAAGQLCAQLYFFLRIGWRGEQEWNLIALTFAIVIIVIVVGGTLWIMNNLAHNLMPADIEAYLDRQ